MRFMAVNWAPRSSLTAMRQRKQQHNPLSKLCKLDPLQHRKSRRTYLHKRGITCQTLGPHHLL